MNAGLKIEIEEEKINRKDPSRDIREIGHTFITSSPYLQKQEIMMEVELPPDAARKGVHVKKEVKVVPVAFLIQSSLTLQSITKGIEALAVLSGAAMYCYCPAYHLHLGLFLKDFSFWIAVVAGSTCSTY